MAITYTIEPNPHWVVIDNFSKLPNGAAIYTFSNKNPSVFKPAYQNQFGLQYGQPIVGNGNGTFDPIYWEFNDAFPDEGYTIEVYDQKIELGGVLLWKFENLFGGGSAGGGGGTITVQNDLENLVVNGQFFRNIGDQPVAPLVSVPALVTLAPSNHAGFVGYANSPNNGPVGPDIIFAKSGIDSTDTLQFVNVTPGTSNLGATNPTPSQFVKYAATAAGTDQYRFIQFPIVKGLQNLSGQTVSVSIWARYASGNSSAVTLNLRQFFGNGGAPASADVPTSLGTLTLTGNSWTQTIVAGVVIPSVGGKNFGTAGNDALYLQLILAPSDVIDIEFILPSMYLVNSLTSSTVNFHTLDQVDAIIDSPRTGDIRMSLNAFSPYGWVPMNDGTIGSAGSAATTRANVDTYPLYDLIWNTFQANQSLAPMSGGAYGVNSFTDFDANRRLTLTSQAGRLIAGVSGSHLIGTIGGADTHTNTIGEMAAHTHPGSTVAFTAHVSAAGGTPVAEMGGPSTAPLVIASQGGASAWDVRQPTVYQNIYIKL